RREMLKFRLNRGAAYMHDLRHYQLGPVVNRPGAASLSINRWQIGGLPAAALVAVTAGLGLLAGGSWVAPVLAALIFLGSATALLLSYQRDQDSKHGLAVLLLTLARMIIIDGYSMLLISCGIQARHSGRK
ncbi:MAG: hypothetical protein ABIK12_18405, partial [Pseudomonadota bacterium]